MGRWDERLPDGVDLHDLIQLRRTLHRHPELSGQEHATRARIVSFLETTAPDALITDIGGVYTAIIDHWLDNPSAAVAKEG
jgi:metal-dependent amidase/aminoacylase/carboxypeptidase family protein